MRFFYEIEGEVFKYEFVNFLRNHGRTINYNGDNVLKEVSQIYEEFYNRKDVNLI